MALLNRGVNIGHSSRLGYDKCYYTDRLSESVSPLLYQLNPNQINNCQACLSVFGPRASHNGYGDSTSVGHTTSPAQDLVDVESILSNRNVVNKLNGLKDKGYHLVIVSNQLGITKGKVYVNRNK